MEPNPEPVLTTLLAEIDELKVQIDQMDRQLGIQQGTIVMQQRIVDALLQTKKMFNILVGALCQNVVNNRPAEAKLVAESILLSLKNAEQKSLRSPTPRPEPELTFPDEPDPSGTSLPTTSTPSSSDPEPPASEPMTSPTSSSNS